MKAFCVFLLTIGCTALLYGEHLSASPSAAQQQSPSRDSSEVGAAQRSAVHGRHSVPKSPPARRQSRGAAVKRSSASNTARPGRPIKLSGTRGQSVSGGAVSSVLRNSDVTVSPKSPVTAYRANSSRTSSFRAGGRSLPTLPSSNPLPHRGPYTAILGGATNTRTAPTGAITGTSMSRKP